MTKNYPSHLGLIGVGLFLMMNIAVAQSPTNLTSNISLPSSASYTNSSSGAPYFLNLTQITNSFNYARRQEEVQLSLGTNTLGTLTLPANYSTISAQQQALYLVNAERQARAGVTYPVSGSVLGLPLEGVETNLSVISQGHAMNMMTTGVFSHTIVGQNSTDRIDASPTFAGSCHEFLVRDENIYKQCLYTSSSTPPSNPVHAVEQAIFSWLYQDAGSSWGHRDALLMQNSSGNVPSPSAPSTNAYDNNYSSSASEGFVGIGVAYASGSNSITTGFGQICLPSSNTAILTKTAATVVFNFVDPPASGCTFTLEANPLPVHLVSFTGVARENKAVLSWATSWERTNLGFDVQRSQTMKSWESIGFVAATTEPQSINRYQFDDEDVKVSVTYYYRLKQRDFDERVTYSKTVAVTILPIEQLVYVYPNPSLYGEFRIFTTRSNTASIDLRDIRGVSHPIAVHSENATTLKVNVGTPLPAGMYWLTVKGDNLLPSQTIKVIVGQ
ncbi:T9SS type A sorting domain-containing protein [Spirosoma sp. KNUC1025]|uniref:T9SS type A sorting domain-containing protein n=1 Tax=Spirosoma sp. KNUC1025 TaxID=2894082 RepID=UPI003865B84D|nr:T9SS type A sorting domain-containing protein [Spirosoma sp. KNUC1025]